MKRLIAGCMTGTSCDGLDACLVEITGSWPQMRAKIAGFMSCDLGDLGRRLHSLSLGRPAAAAEWANAALELGELHAAILKQLCGGRAIDLAVVHGQTVHHAPPASWQLINPHPIARELKTPVLYDLRGADLAAGGQGAPITPIADAVLFADQAPATVANLGGFINYTQLPEDPQAHPDGIRAADLCACNQLLDSIARHAWNEPFDPDGRRAAEGRVDDKHLAEILDRLDRQSRGGRSLGSGDELNEQVPRMLCDLRPEDVAATACRAIARKLASLPAGGGGLVLAGGGVRNARLVSEIRREVPAPVHLSSERGIDPMAREAAAMAILGALCQDGVALTLPQVTGCRVPAPRSGCWVQP